MSWQRYIVMGWIVVCSGFAGDLGGQDEERDGFSERSLEIFDEVVNAGTHSTPRDLAVAWVEALGEELGADDPEILLVLRIHARYFFEQGLYHESQEFFEREIEMSTRVLGSEHSDTLAARGGLAQVLMQRGDLQRALSLQRQVLEAETRRLGEEHPTTLLNEVAVAGILNQLGDFQGARDAYRKALPPLARSFGKEDPLILRIQGNFAVTLRALGDLEGSRALQEEMVGIGSRVLGEEHSDLLVAKSNLAGLLRALGDLAGARKLYEELLEVSVRVLGEEHPNTLTIQGNLALVLYLHGDLKAAVRLEREVLANSTRILGAEHPNTLTIQFNHAITLRGLGDLAEARRLEEEVLAVRLRTLGAEHPDTLESMAALARTLYQLGDLVGARQRQERLLETLGRYLGPDHPDTLDSKIDLSVTLVGLGELDSGLRLSSEALEVFERKLGAEHPRTLGALENQASTLRRLGDLQGARELAEKVLAARTRAFGSDHPTTWRAKAELAYVLSEMGEHALARQQQEEILATRTRHLGEDHPETLLTKEGLAVTQMRSGDLLGARQLLEVVLATQLEIFGEKHPDSLRVQGNLALVLREMGEVAEARELEEKVLAARGKLLGAQHPDTLMAKANLAATLELLGDLATVLELEQEVLEARTRIFGEEHPDTLMAKVNLAGTLDALGDLQGALERWEEILRVQSPVMGATHPATLKSRLNLAVTRRELGDLAGSRQESEEVLAIQEQTLGPSHPDTLKAQASLARTLLEAGDLGAARQTYEELLSNRSAARGAGHLAPTEEEANNYFFLARTLYLLGELESAQGSYLRGLEALEAQVLRLDRSEKVQVDFRDGYANAYRDAVAIAIERDRPGEALSLLERYRTQSLMNLLRWSRPEGGIQEPEAWRMELAEIAQKYDGLTRQIHASFPAPVDALLDEQSRLRRRREVIQGQIIDLRRQAEGIPEPLDLDQICQTLDPGTVLLAYDLGPRASRLLLLTPEHGVEVHSLEVSLPKLWRQVEDLRNHDQDGDTALGESRRRMAQWLFDRLLRTAEARIDTAQRVVVLPDGPLHYLPFAALVRPIDDDPRGWQYVAEWKPFHTVQSMTVYRELQARRPGHGARPQVPWQWVGFGDPYFPELADDDPTRDASRATALGSSTERRLWSGLAALPHSRSEVERIRAQFPEGRAKILVESQATEDEARNLLGDTRIAHFATHGVADPDFPLDSFLVLSLLEDEALQHNGLLQAWEVLEDLQLDADLVVLSACVTALGPERRGEGLISLSRAFQIAGARSVLASLWSVDDFSTSELMVRFYRNLLDRGMSQDVALQQAQIELIRGPIAVVDANGEERTRDFSAPHHWAAFQLMGDWM